MTAGDHTRTIVVSSSTHGSLSKFTLKRQVCLGCRAVLSDDALALCDHCAPRTAEIYARLLAGTNDLEARFNRLWTQCQRCQGSVVNEVLCTSRDCVRVLSACVVALGGAHLCLGQPIFYMRSRVRKDLQESSATLKRFDLSW